MNEKYIQALKKMRVGDGSGDPDSSMNSDTEQEEEFIMGQKIFFTDGGRTNKVINLILYII